MRHAALALALVAGAVAQAAHAQVKLPFSPPPRLAVASGVDPKTDSLECAYHTVRFIWEIQTLTEKRDGVDVRTAMPVRRNIFESRVVSIPLDKARVFDAAGQELSKAEVILRLTPDSVIALSADGNPVDPLYLKALAKDTLVVASIDYAVNNVDASGASPAIYAAPMPYTPGAVDSVVEFNAPAYTPAPAYADPAPIPAIPAPPVRQPGTGAPTQPPLYQDSRPVTPTSSSNSPYPTTTTPFAPVPAPTLEDADAPSGAPTPVLAH